MKSLSDGFAGMSLRESRTLEIGGLAIGIDWDSSLGPLSSDGLYDNFVSGAEPEVGLSIHNGLPPFTPDSGELVFDSQSHWKLFETDGNIIVSLQSPLEGHSPYCVALFDGRYLHGEVYRIGPTSDIELIPGTPGALDHTLMQLLTLSLMSRGRGMMLHACGIEHHGRGYLFLGNSGDGKSTMARLWGNRGLVLNDDRIVLRRSEGVVQMYGTPWHGDFRSGVSHGVPLERCFFLDRGESNEAIGIKGSAACSMLLARAFLPLWDKDGVRFTLDFASELVAEIPTHVLTFVPTEEVADFILCLR
jgi:hypothetical protein